jgi:DNA-binding Xre family transcriptional regulator
MNPPELDEHRFWSKVDTTGECWLWMGSRRPLGYGAVKVGGRVLHAHRVAYELTHGSIPEGFVVMHRCDNPPCVNPAHLHLGTRSENTRDMHAKGRTGQRQRGTRRFKQIEPINVRVCLRKLAEARGLNIGKIGRLTGLTEGTIRRLWYNEVIYVELGVLGTLADMFGIEPGDLLERVT